MSSSIADGGANLIKQEDEFAARMRKLHGRVPTTVILITMVQEKVHEKRAMDEVRLKVCDMSSPHLVNNTTQVSTDRVVSNCLFTLQAPLLQHTTDKCVD